MTTQTQGFNPIIVECLRILARRGRAVREAMETADAGKPGSDSASAAGDALEHSDGTPLLSRETLAASSGGDV